VLGRIVSFILSFALAAQSGFAGASGTVVLEPSSNWQLDYGETRCRILRTFGEDDQQSVLYFEQYSPSEQFDWVVAGPLLHRYSSGQKIGVQFGPGQLPYAFRPEISLTLGDFGTGIGGGSVEDASSEKDEKKGENYAGPVGLPSLPVEQGAGIDWVELSRSGRSYRLKTGNLGPVYEALNACMADLVTHWGANPEILKTRKTLPEIVNLQRVARLIQEHYPGKAERKGAQANLLVRVMVEADGTVARCHMESMTAAEGFDNTACVVFVENAKFKPATDLQDRPIPSYYTVRVSYRLH